MFPSPSLSLLEWSHPLSLDLHDTLNIDPEKIKKLSSLPTVHKEWLFLDFDDTVYERLPSIKSIPWAILNRQELGNIWVLAYYSGIIDIAWCTLFPDDLNSPLRYNISLNPFHKGNTSFYQKYWHNNYSIYRDIILQKVSELSTDTIENCYKTHADIYYSKYFTSPLSRWLALGSEKIIDQTNSWVEIIMITAWVSKLQTYKLRNTATTTNNTNIDDVIITSCSLDKIEEIVDRSINKGYTPSKITVYEDTTKNFISYLELLFPVSEIVIKEISINKQTNVMETVDIYNYQTHHALVA